MATSMALGCECCQKVFSVSESEFRRRTPRFCSYVCRGKATAEDKKRLSPNGYVLVYVSPDSPYASMRTKNKSRGYPNSYVFEHRLVMAEHLGRPLSSVEKVHHINGDKQDNRLENLQLRTTNHGAGVCLRCRTCGSIDIESVEL